MLDEHVRQSDGRRGCSPPDAINEYSWLLRLQGQPREALAEVDRWLFEKPGVYRTTQLPLLLERARLHAALEEWEQAESDIEDLFRLTKRDRWRKFRGQAAP